METMVGGAMYPSVHEQGIYVAHHKKARRGSREQPLHQKRAHQGNQKGLGVQGLARLMKPYALF